MTARTSPGTTPTAPTTAGSMGGSLTPLLVELRSAIAAGAPPGMALEMACGRPSAGLPELHDAARALALGVPLAQVARELPPETGPAGLLVRALAVAESSGAGAAEAVAQTEAAVAEERELQRLLQVRTAQARGSLRVLTLAPPGVVAFFVLLQPDALRFYATGAGRVTAAAAVGLTLVAHRWARRIVHAVPRAAAAADPLGQAEGGGAEVAELLAVALRGGLPPVAAVRLVGDVGPPAGRTPLLAAERALSAGLPLEAAFAGTPLRTLGALLEAPLRWGARAEAVLRAYSAGLRADRRAALAEAAERAQLRLVFPTTLLTLPSFLLAVVPPLVWTGLQP